MRLWPSIPTWRWQPADIGYVRSDYSLGVHASTTTCSYFSSFFTFGVDLAILAIRFNHFTFASLTDWPISQ
jgi:hypothetical protein